MSKWSGRGQPPTRRKLKRLRQARLLEQGEPQRHAPVRLNKRWVWHGRELERMTSGCVPEEEGGGVHVLET